ncbi:MAG: hypothetical protein GXO29_03100 [Thermotogae bacterium]|nr:hypothetical protein [Thermotogota bacterium]
MKGKRESLRKLVEEVDILLFLAEKGRQERRMFAWQMFVWGAYAFVGLSAELLFGWNLQWVIGLAVAFFLSTLPYAGPLRSLVWFLPSVAALLVLLAGGGTLLTVATLIVGYAVASVVVYGFLTKGEYRRVSTLAYLGMTWGTLFAAFWWVVLLFGLVREGRIFNLWITYVFGSGLFLSGLFHRIFVPLGLAALFILPLLYRLKGALWLGWGYATIALVMGVAGLIIYVREHDRGP